MTNPNSTSPVAEEKVLSFSSEEVIEDRRPSTIGELMEPGHEDQFRQLVTRALPLNELQAQITEMQRTLARAELRDGATIRGVGQAFTHFQEVVLNLKSGVETFAENIHSQNADAVSTIKKESKTTFLKTAALTVLCSVIGVATVIYFVQWQRMESLRSSIQKKSKEIAALDITIGDKHAEDARLAEAVANKQRYADALEVRHNDLLQKLASTGATLQSVAGARSELQSEAVKQKLIPGTKPGEYFVAIDPNYKIIADGKGNYYIRVK